MVQRGKRGPMSRGYVHRAADMHAYRHPHRRVQVPRTERHAARFLRDYAATAYREMTKRIRAKFKLRMPNNQDFIDLRNELTRVAAEFFDDYNPAMKRGIRDSYARGAMGAQLALGLQDAAPMPGANFRVSFTLPDREAMRAIANDNFSDLAGQTHNMIDGAVKILRTTAGKIIRRRLAQGLHPTRVARELEVELIRRGFEPGATIKKFFATRNKHTNPYNKARPSRRLSTPADAVAWIAENGPLKFIDKGGKEWDLRAYCEMAAHTKLMIAKNEGTRARMRAAGVNHYMFSSHGTECDICAPHEGKIYWTGDGESLGYDEGPDIPLHPNCGHTTLPYVIEAFDD